MTDGSIEAYIGLLVQVPLVGLFIWFALRQSGEFLKAMEKRDEQWRDYLRSQTESTIAAISRIAEEVKNLGREVSELRGRNGQ